MNAQNAIRSHHFSAILAISDDIGAWSGAKLAEALSRAARASTLNPIGRTSADFKPQGASAVVLLEESHVAAHIWPELGKITFDIHICDYSRDNRDKAAKLADALSVLIEGSHDNSGWKSMILEG